MLSFFANIHNRVIVTASVEFFGKDVVEGRPEKTIWSASLSGQQLQRFKPKSKESNPMFLSRQMEALKSLTKLSWIWHVLGCGSVGPSRRLRRPCSYDPVTRTYKNHIPNDLYLLKLIIPWWNTAIVSTEQCGAHQPTAPSSLWGWSRRCPWCHR